MLKESLKKLYPVLAGTFDLIVEEDNLELDGRSYIVIPRLKADKRVIMDKNNRSVQQHMVGFSRHNLFEIYAPKLPFIVLFTFSKKIWYAKNNPQKQIQYRYVFPPDQQPQDFVEDKTVDVMLLYNYQNNYIPVILEGWRSKWFVVKDVINLAKTNALEPPFIITLEAELRRGNVGEYTGIKLSDIQPLKQEDSRITFLSVLLKEHIRYRLGKVSSSPLYPSMEQNITAEIEEQETAEDKQNEETNGDDDVLSIRF